MAKTALDLPRANMFRADPHKNLVIVTAEKHDNPGPQDIVDVKHPLCEKHERPISEEEIRDVNKRGILQPIKVRTDGDELGIVIFGRRRTRMARAVNELRQDFNEGRTNWLFETARAKGDAELPMLTIEVIPMRGTDLELRGAMLAENMQRADYSPIQVAQAFQEYMQLGATPTEAAAVAGKKSFYVESHLSILDCAPEVQKAIDGGRVSVTAAHELSKLTREEQKDELEHLGPGEKLTLVKATRATKKKKKGADFEDAPTKGEVTWMLDAVKKGEGEFTPTQRENVVAILKWVQKGTRPRDFKLPKKE